MIIVAKLFLVVGLFALISAFLLLIPYVIKHARLSQAIAREEAAGRGMNVTLLSLEREALVTGYALPVVGGACVGLASLLLSLLSYMVS
ncbi:hypothetical protein AAY80_254 [Stenotrophomonas phage vB_SmaS-DLP_6]|nr:hypothetical protein AAY80_254 [Stenotrophomonas phage vB_SmaS-DLP_6]